MQVRSELTSPVGLTSPELPAAKMNALPWLSLIPLGKPGCSAVLLHLLLHASSLLACANSVSHKGTEPACQEFLVLQRRQSPTPCTMAAGTPYSKRSVRLKLWVFVLRTDGPGMCWYHPERQDIQAGNQQKGSTGTSFLQILPFWTKLC